MQINQIKPKTKIKNKKRVGRGGKKGTYSGRGMKGQLSRSGHKKTPVIRELIKKYHKLRGYRFNPSSEKNETVNLSNLQKKFNANEIVSPTTLIEKGLINKVGGKFPIVKILSNGSLTKKLTIKECFLSKLAVEKIKEAGGKIIKSHVVQ